MSKVEAKQMVSAARDLDAVYLRVVSAPIIGSFTGLRSTMDVRSEASLPLLDLWKVDEETFWQAAEDIQIAAAVHRFTAVAKDTNTAHALATALCEYTDERHQFLAIVETVIVPLTGQVSMAVNVREYPESLVVGKPVHREHLGMGTTLTWHGAPDGRSEIDFINVDLTDDDDESAGAKTPIEMKMDSWHYQNMNQVLGNAVVYSFVANTRHPRLNPLVPVLGLSGTRGQLVIAAYDARCDVLIYSNPITWLDLRSSSFRLEGLLILWLALHHRLFLRQVVGDEPASGLQNILDQAGALHRYRQLASMNVKGWPGLQLTVGVPRLKRSRQESEGSKE